MLLVTTLACVVVVAITRIVITLAALRGVPPEHRAGVLTALAGCLRWCRHHRH